MTEKKKQSLHEAAAEILKASASGAPGQPQQHLGKAPGEQGDTSGLGTGENLGGDFPDKVAPENYTKDGRSTTGGKAKEPGPAPRVAQMPKDKLKNNNKSIDIDKQRQGPNAVTVDGYHKTDDPQLTGESVEGDEELDILVDDEGNVFDPEGNHIPGLFVTEEGELVQVDENGEILSEEDGDENGEEVYVDEDGNVIEGNEEDELEESVILFDREAIYEDFKKNLDADLGAILEGDTFSDDEKQQIRTVFEAAVLARVDQLADVLEEAFMGTLSQSVEEVKVQLAEKTEDYLNYIAEEWMKENEIAVESGIRTELTEDFINGLKALFQEHYIDIPEDKIDVVGELTEEVAQAEAKLDEQIARNVELSKKVKMFEAAEVFATVCEDLTDVQVDKMRQLAEGIEFTAAGEFKNKLEMLRDNYFNNGGTRKLTEGTKQKVDGGLNEVIEIDDDKTKPKSNDREVNAFVAALDRAKS